MIDLISEMLTAGIIDRSGKFSLNKEHSRIDEAQGEAAFIDFSTNHQFMQQRDVVIIIGGPAGRVIAHALHSQNSGMSVTLIKDEAINPGCQWQT
jgi:ribulose 1,5-bisphosphate synthetase/thiazole synthase